MCRKALVLGSGTRSFLSVVRSLGRGGVEVHVAWHELDTPALCSRYIYKVHTLSPYGEHSEVWKTDLIALMQSEAFDLVLPCNDPTFIPLQRHHRDLERFGRLYLLNDRAFNVLFDKFKTNELARAAGVLIPRETLVTHHEEIALVKSTFGMPLVLKPLTSFDLQNPSIKQVVRKAYNWEDFDKSLMEMLARGPVVVQEYIHGTGVGVELLMQDGEPLMAFQHVRVHEPLEGGGSSYRQSVAVSPQLQDAALKLLHPLRYTGVAMVEFKVNFKTGVWALMEVNGRFWGSLPLALAAGADFPLALFQLLVEGRTSFPQHFRMGLYSRNLVADLGWQWANLRADGSNPLLSTHPLSKVLAETFVNVFTGKERSDTFTRDDPGPGWAEVRQMMAVGLRSLAEEFTKHYLQLPLVRWLLALRARTALAQARTVLFVCKGNICRSPFGAYLARNYFPADIRVLSAGYYPESGRCSPDVAVKAAAHWDIDLSRHRSKVLTEDLVRQVEVVFVFDFHNFRRVTADYRFSRDRIHFVGALCPDGPLFIADPFGQDIGCFERTYQQVERSLYAAARHLIYQGQADQTKAVQYPSNEHVER